MEQREFGSPGDRDHFKGAKDLLAQLQGESVEGPELSESARSVEAESTRKTLAERHPDWPPIALDFYFAPHGSAKDIPDLPGKLQGADVYLYEAARGRKGLSRMQELADANPADFPADHIETVVDTFYGSDESIRGTFDEAQLRALYGSGVVVGHIDLRAEEEEEDHEIAEKIFEAYARPYDKTASFDEVLAQVRGRATDIAKWQHKREQVMLERLEPELEAILERHPELKQKSELRVVDSVGAFHTALHHEAVRTMGVEATRSFPGRPYSFNYRGELERSMRFGKEPSRDLLAKAYIEAVFDPILDGFIEDRPVDRPSSDLRDNTEWAMYTRKIASAFPTEEIEYIHDLRRHNELADEDIITIISDVHGLGPLPRTMANVGSYLRTDATQ
ncbi:MAG TPA: hypothetical protein VMT30_07665 [Candidatus Saccharimonadia bacterium]|nr:hypothetical protein [Candidatus Saccharimonadia bacterium]